MKDSRKNVLNRDECSRKICANWRGKGKKDDIHTAHDAL